MYIRNMQILLLLFLLLPCSLSAQVILSGRVIEEGGDALSFATVRLLSAAGAELVAGTTTDVAGDFRLAAPPGSYQLRVDFLGYATSEQTLSLIGAITLPDIMLWVSFAASPLANGYDGL